METLSLHYQAWRDAFVSQGLSFIDEEEFYSWVCRCKRWADGCRVAAKLNYTLDIKELQEYKKNISWAIHYARYSDSKTFAIVKVSR